MTARSHVPSLIGDAADLLFVGNIHDPDFLYIVLLIEMIRIFFEKRPIDGLAIVNCPSQRISAVRGH